jgi:hypothetical protein
MLQAIDRFGLSTNSRHDDRRLCGDEFVDSYLWFWPKADTNVSDLLKQFLLVETRLNRISAARPCDRAAVTRISAFSAPDPALPAPGSWA